MERREINVQTGKETVIKLTAEEIADFAKNAPTKQDLIKRQIFDLESKITPRRLREAVLGDNTWVKNQETEINKLRDQL